MIQLLALLTLLVVTPVAAQEVTWPAPVTAGGAMPVQWDGITSPTPTDWVGLYPPEGSKYDFLEWIYVSCSQSPNFARSTGTCGFVVPNTVPPGVYELRLYAADGYNLIAKSTTFQVIDGGWR
jgi:hypothetical protein